MMLDCIQVGVEALLTRQCASFSLRIGGDGADLTSKVDRVLLQCLVIIHSVAAMSPTRIVVQIGRRQEDGS